MSGVILVLGLIAAGIYTGNVAFYWVAGALGVLALLFQILVVSFFKSVKKDIDKHFDNDDFFSRPSIVRNRNRRRF